MPNFNGSKNSLLSIRSRALNTSKPNWNKSQNEIECSFFVLFFSILVFVRNVRFKMYPAGWNKCICHQIDPRGLGGNVVKTISCAQSLVCLMVHHRTRKWIVADHVGDFAIVFNYECVDDATLRQKPVTEFLLVKNWDEVELFQVLQNK